MNMIGVQKLFTAIEQHNNKEAKRLIADGVSIYRPVKGADTAFFHAMVHENEEMAHILSQCYERDMRVVWAGRKNCEPVLVAHGRYQIARVRDMAHASMFNISDSEVEDDDDGGRTKSRIEGKKIFSTEKVLLFNHKYPEVIIVTFHNSDVPFRQELTCNGLLDVNYKTHREQTYLHLAAVRGYTDIFKRMLKLGTDPYQKDVCGDTCLFLAVLTGRLDITNMLFKVPRIDARQCNDKGMSLIAAAAQNGSVPLFNEVLNKAVQSAMKEQNKELWDYAAAAKVTHQLLNADDNLIHMDSNIAIVVHLINLYLPEKYTDIAFSLMIKYNNYPMVKKMIKHGADVFRTLPPHDKNAMYIAADSGSLEAFNEIAKQYTSAAFKDNKFGCVEALHRAIYCRHHAIAERLLDLGVDPNAYDDSLGYSYNAVHLCAYWNDVKMIQSLIKRGADLRKLDVDSHQTALGIALNKGHRDIVKELKYSIKHQS